MPVFFETLMKNEIVLTFFLCRSETILKVAVVLVASFWVDDLLAFVSRHDNYRPLQKKFLLKLRRFDVV